MEKYKWHFIAYAENDLQFQKNNLLQVEVAGKKICIAKTDNGLFGCASKCPHAGGIIADGFIDHLSNIVCPLHRYKFNLQNGRNVSGEGYYLLTYPVRKTDEGIFVGIKEKGLFSWL